mgnify:CR=1 FL=1
MVTQLAQRLSIRLFLSTVMSVTISPSVYAQNEGRWYQVELLIFKRNPAAINTNEIWRNDIELSYPSNTRYITETVDKSTHEQGGHNSTLRLAKTNTVQCQNAWQQQLWRAEVWPASLLAITKN